VGDLTFGSAGAVPLARHSRFVRHSSSFTPRFGSSESESISRRLSNVDSTLSVEGPQQTSWNFVPKARRQTHRSSADTVPREVLALTEAHR